jgi:hypothetical protein
VDRLIVNVASFGAAALTLSVEGEVPQPVGSFDLTWPLDAEDGESLRWYGEDFLPGENVGGSSCSIELRSGRGSAEMISDGCSYANREIVIKRVGENRCQRPKRVRFVSWPCGSGSRHLKPSCRPVGPPDSG